MKGFLQGKKGIITGVLNRDSIAYYVAKKAVEAGAHIVLTNLDVATRLGNIKEIAQELNAPFIPADLTKVDDIKNVFQFAIENFKGSIDFFLHSIAMSFNIRRKKNYYEIDYELFKNTLDISAISLHKILRVSYEMDIFSEWASVVTISYIAAERVVPGYNDMADAKALLESIVRNFGYYYAKKKKVRINAVSPSPMQTTAAKSIPDFDNFLSYAENASPLGNAQPQDCANLIIFLFSDYSRYITMQTIYCDGGFNALAMHSNRL